MTALVLVVVVLVIALLLEDGLGTRQRGECVLRRLRERRPRVQRSRRGLRVVLVPRKPARRISGILRSDL